MNKFELFNEDCLKKLKDLSDESIDLVLSDPPYGLEFMGKDWDKFSKIESNKKRWEGKRKGKMIEGIELEGTGFKTLPSFNFSNNLKCKVCGHYQFSGTPCKCEKPEWEQRTNPHLEGYQNFTTQWASAVLPKMKAGSFLVFTMSPRQDLLWRCLAGLEKAGFELKHSGLFWLYHTGFPKASDVSKGIDKRNNRTQETYIPFGRYLKEKRNEKGLSMNQIDSMLGTNTAYSWWEGRKAGIQLPSKDFYLKLKSILDLDNRFDELIERTEAERKIVGKSNTGYSEIMGSKVEGKGNGLGNEVLKYDITEPNLEDAKRWSGFKSFSLKPAVECIVVAQKPKSEKTIVGQVLDNGCGAVNIESCRIPTDETGLIKGGCKFKSGHFDNSENTMDSEYSNDSRFPANLLVSEKNVLSKNSCMYDLNAWALKRNITLTEDSAFFDVAKPSKKEKNLGLDKVVPEKVNDGRKAFVDNAFQRGETLRKNVHPTTKPVKLFCYLSELFCQPNGVVLDCFMGSGTTGVACAKMNKHFIGIELNKEYFEIAEKRITEASKQIKLGE